MPTIKNPKVIDEPFDSKYEKCEGDYLFLILLDYYWKHSDPRLLLENFYFLTAYGEPNTIQESLGKLHLLFDTGNHVIEKGSEQQKAFIEANINKFEELVIKSKHRQVFEIFSKGYLAANFENALIEVLKNINTKDKTKIEGYICNLRNVFQEILRKIIEINEIAKAMPENYFKAGNLKPGSILWFLAGSPKFNQTKELKETHSNEYISNCIYSFADCFWTVSSEILHGGKSENREKKYNLRHYTLPALANIVMDFQIWFKSFMDENNN